MSTTLTAPTPRHAYITDAEEEPGVGCHVAHPGPANSVELSHTGAETEIGTIGARKSTRKAMGAAKLRAILVARTREPP